MNDTKRKQLILPNTFIVYGPRSFNVYFLFINGYMVTNAGSEKIAIVLSTEWFCCCIFQRNRILPHLLCSINGIVLLMTAKRVSKAPLFAIYILLAKKSIGRNQLRIPIIRINCFHHTMFGHKLWYNDKLAHMNLY